jgi:hypothetical protein
VSTRVTPIAARGAAAGTTAVGPRPGCVDGLLRAVADEAVVEVFITDTELRRTHPFGRHANWLSTHPAGL